MPGHMIVDWYHWQASCWKAASDTSPKSANEEKLATRAAASCNLSSKKSKESSV